MGCSPAQQRLDRFDHTSAQVDDRLVIEPELEPFDRAVQLGLHAEPGERTGVQSLVEELEALPAAAFGVMHGGIGAAQQLLAVRLPVAERHPDAERDGQPLTVDFLQWLVEGVDDAFRERAGGAVGTDPFAEHDELVAAQARHRCTRRHELAEPGRDGHEQIVARRVAEPVVDDVEAVEVEQQQGDGRSPGPRTRDRAVETVGERARGWRDRSGNRGAPAERVVARTPCGP